MIAIVAFVLAALNAQAEIRGLSVMPAAEQTHVLIHVEGPVGSIEHFLLEDPARLVLDLGQSRNGLQQAQYPGVARGGIRAIRTSQYQPTVVRVVLDLDGPVHYSIESVPEGIRVQMPNPDGDFEVWNSRTVPVVPVMPPAAVAAPARTPPVQQVQLAQQQRRITVYFQETPLRDVLATFSEFSGRSIVQGTGVTGNISADIRNQPWDVALHEILHAHNFFARETEDGIIRVSDLRGLRERVDLEELVTRSFTIRYISVDSILGTVRGLLADVDTAGVQRSNVVSNKSTNTLFVTAGASVLQRIEPMIRELDVRPPQVTIAAQIIFVDRSALEEYGIVYDLKDSRGNRINTLIRPQGDPTDADIVVTLSGSSIAGLGNANNRVSSPTLQLIGSLVFGRHSLTTFIEALGQKTLTDIQARPVVTTMSHREARVQVGERTPVRILDPSTAVGPGQVGARATVEMVQTGVILRVTPHVTGDQVLLELHAERSNLALAPADLGYTFQTQESQTQVLLNDGETAVIGGLTVTEKHELRTGIPFLMDLPFVGALFRLTNDREVKQDLLIMVTPHIVRDGDE